MVEFSNIKCLYNSLLSPNKQDTGCQLIIVGARGREAFLRLRWTLWSPSGQPPPSEVTPETLPRERPNVVAPSVSLCLGAGTDYSQRASCYLACLLCSPRVGIGGRCTPALLSGGAEWMLALWAAILPAAEESGKRATDPGSPRVKGHKATAIFRQASGCINRITACRS